MAFDNQKSNKKAIVIGGSMAGLLAARVLCEIYDEVVVIERDMLPASAEQRKGVPQGWHAHALLSKGREILETLFPGLTQQLTDLGAPLGSGRFYAGGGYLCRFENNLRGLFVSRPCLETAVRKRLLERANVTVLEQRNVAGITSTADRRRVTGVRLSGRGIESSSEVLSADLVVDASGRGSHAPAWLESLGYAGPEIERVEVKMGYASRLYRRLPGDLNGDLITNVAPTRKNKRASGMLAQEGNRWVVTLAGYFGDYPPTDAEGFLAFARSLAASDIYELIRTAEPLSDPVTYRFPADQWRHYEKLARFPEGFLVIGDAICSFTPIYGQGMTVAAMEALALRESLAAGEDRLAQRFFNKTSQIVNGAWSIAAGNDSNLAEDRSAMPLKNRFINWYMGRLQFAARRDPVVAFAFMNVANMVAAPPSLMYPHIAARVFWGNLRPWKSNGFLFRKSILTDFSASNV